MRKPFSLFWLIAINSCILTAEDFCSLTVQISDPQGSRISRVLTTVREKSGGVVQKESVSGNAYFCDLGMRPITVTVGRDSCNQTTVQDVPIVWQAPYILKITYDPQPCIRHPPAPSQPLCYVLLRVSDFAGQWIEKATVHFERPEFPAFQTDSAGRSLLYIGVNGSLSGSIAASGFITKHFSFSCLRSEVRDEFIKLNRAE